MSSIIKENTWDDGKQEKVKSVEVTYDENVVHSIEVEYEGTKLKSQLRGSVGTESAKFTLDSDEHITAMDAYVKKLSSQDGIESLTFKTNKRPDGYGPYGKQKSSFMHSALEVPGKHIAGFFGSFQKVLNTIDVHYAYIGEQKLEAVGANLTWDDGSSDHEGVTKISIRHHLDHGIISVQFDYIVKGDEEPKKGLVRGTGKGMEGIGTTDEFVIKHPEEYLVSVEGWHDSAAIRGIQFKTNNNKNSTYFGKELPGDGTKFTLQVPGKRIIGFHGSASNLLHTIGAYVVPINHVIKVKARGGEEGVRWDDGGKYENVKGVVVRQGRGAIVAIKFFYTTKDNKVVAGPFHGNPEDATELTLELDSDEYITHMDGTYENTSATGGDHVLVSVIFYTNKDRKPRRYGKTSGKELGFTKRANYKIIGFHGRADDRYIHAIGFYSAPIEGPAGGNGETSSDDGVKKVIPITN